MTCASCGAKVVVTSDGECISCVSMWRRARSMAASQGAVPAEQVHDDVTERVVYRGLRNGVTHDQDSGPMTHWLNLPGERERSLEASPWPAIWMLVAIVVVSIMAGALLWGLK